MIMKCFSCRRKNAPVTQVCKDHANQHPGIWRPLVHTSRVESRAIRLTATYGRLIVSNSSPLSPYTDKLMTALVPLTGTGRGNGHTAADFIGKQWYCLYF